MYLHGRLYQEEAMECGNCKLENSINYYIPSPEWFLLTAPAVKSQPTAVQVIKWKP